MAREMLLAGVDPEELKPQERDQGPRTPRSRWENFWYHHKWTFFGCLFGAAVLAVLVVQLITRDPADYTILLITKNSYMDEQIKAMEMLMAPYGQDLDGDGKVEVDIQNCYMGEQGSQTYLNGTQMVQAHLMTGDVVFFVWEPSVYKSFTKSISRVERRYISDIILNLLTQGRRSIFIASKLCKGKGGKSAHVWTGH